MDPNAALARIREILANYDHASDEHELANELVDLIAGLDSWLSKGGYLPRTWSRGGGSFSPRNFARTRQWVDSYGNEYAVEETLAGTTTFRRKDVAHTTPPDAPHTVDS